MFDINNEQKKSKRFRKDNGLPLYEMVKDEARRFCLDTGLHGFQFIAMNSNTPTERFIWTFISFGALLTALILSFKSWMYSTTYPTMIVTDSMEHPISNFLYPAISICNLNKISKRKAYDFVNESLKVENVTYWQFRMHLLAQMYFANYDTTDSKAYSQLQDLLDKNNVTAEEALVRVTPDCKQLFQSCMWKSRKIRCDRLLQLTRTPEGTCCTFNHFAFKNRVFSGYMADRYKPYPKKLASCGHQTGLQVLIRHDPKDYLASEISAFGAKVVVHDTYNYPDWSSQRVLIPMGTQVYVDVNPNKLYATEDVRAMSIKKRNCVFRDERALKIFANYSYENCLIECRIHILGKVCGCMPFYLRNEWTDWTPPLRMCDLRDISCISANKQRFMSSVPGYDAYKTKGSQHVWGTETSECDCRPDCEKRMYVVHSTKGKLSRKEQVNNLQFYGSIQNTNNYSVISIFFKDLTAKRIKRDVSINWSSIFGLFGGLLGLCLGFTFIAVFEVIYTFTIRLALNISRKKNLSKVHQTPFVDNINVLPVVYNPMKFQNKTYKSDIWFYN